MSIDTPNKLYLWRAWTEDGAPFRATGKQGLWEIDDALVQAAYPEVRRG